MHGKRKFSSALPVKSRFTVTLKCISGGMLCQVICRASILGIVYLVQTSTADFKWIVPAIFGVTGIISSVLVYSIPDRSTKPLMNTIANIKQLYSISGTLDKAKTRPTLIDDLL